MSSAIVFNTIRAAAHGEMLLQPAIMERVLAHTTRPSPPTPTHEPLILTDREVEILAHVARGDRNKEIAVRLKISESTIKAHLASIYAKLGVDSRASAVATALERDVLPRPSGMRQQRDS